METPVPNDPEVWRPWWAYLIAILGIVLAVFLILGFVPDFVRGLETMRDHGQDLSNTIYVYGSMIGAGVIALSAFPLVWFLFTGAENTALKVLFFLGLSVISFFTLGVMFLLEWNLSLFINNGLDTLQRLFR